MIKSGEITNKANLLGVEAKQIEKDYVITWLLYGLSRNNLLRDNLVFKGGTVLKKVYYEDYRFSEDMDFTLLDDGLEDEKMEAAFNQVFDFLREETAMDFRLERPKHNFYDTFSFYIEYIASLGGSFQSSRKVKVDITRGEILEYPIDELPVFRDYSDIENIEFTIKCYSLAEVIIEKMAALMGRSQPRDLFDLWVLFEDKSFDILDYWFAFENKVENKNKTTDKKIVAKDFTEVVSNKENTFKKRWEMSLQHQIKELPNYTDVFRELSRHFRKIDKFLKK